MEVVAAVEAQVVLEMTTQVLVARVVQAVKVVWAVMAAKVQTA